MAVYRGGGEVLVTATSAYQMKFSQWRPLSRVVVIKSRERRKFYAKIVGKWNGQGSRRGGDRAELGQHPVFLRQCHSPPSLSTRMRLRPRRVRVSAIQRGEWKSCFALLPGIDGLSFRYFLDRVFFFLFLFLKIELSAGESTVHEIFRKVERSGFMEGKFCCEYFVARYEIFARVT